MNFNYYLPVNLLFGRGRVKELGTETAKWGKKAVIVTGTSSTKRSGLLDRAIDFLTAAGVASVVFDKVTQNPLTTTCMEGARLAKESGCDVVVALGGGSIMDAAKGIAFLCRNDGDINDYIFNRRISDLALPLIAVPTTCGTGSEGNCFAVLTNPDNGDKKSLRCNAIVAKASIIDSELMQTMPKSVLSSVTFDALCHCMEAYTSLIAQPMTDALCLSGISLLAENMVRIYQGDASADAWDAVTWASTIGGMVINTAGVALPHGMEHPASGLKNIVHGRGLAALTPVIVERSFRASPQRYGTISRLLGGQSAGDCADRIRHLLEEIDLDVTLGQQGITAGDIPWMCENVQRVAAGNLNNHPAKFTPEEIAAIYEAAL